MAKIYFFSLIFFVCWVHAQPVSDPNRRDDKTVTKIQVQGNSRQESHRNPHRQPVKVTDAQALEILKAINQADLDMSRKAQKKGGALSVTSFSEQLEKDHREMMRALANFESQSRLTPQDNPISQEIRREGEKKSEDLQKLAKSEFDRSYLDYEASAHNKGLEIIDTDLLPQVQNPELRQLINKTRSSLETHMQRASYTRQTLNNPGL